MGQLPNFVFMSFPNIAVQAKSYETFRCLFRRLNFLEGACEDA